MNTITLNRPADIFDYYESDIIYIDRLMKLPIVLESVSK